MSESHYGSRNVSLHAALETAAGLVQALVDIKLAGSSDAIDSCGLRDGIVVVRDYPDHGEYGVAFEHVVYMIRELDLLVPAGVYQLLTRAARELQLGAAGMRGVRSVPSGTG